MTDYPEPMQTKSKEMRFLLRRWSEWLTSLELRGGHCYTCGKEITSFKDALSEQEYAISGMCQECQDSVFGS